MKNNFVKKYADLHIHSNYSDGTLSPSEIFLAAKRANIQCVSISDHDTLAATDDAIASAKKYNIEFISGIEFSADWKIPIHILGYYLDHKNEKLNAVLEQLKLARSERAKNIIAKLKSFGLAVDYDELLQMINIKTAGRPHIAQYLVQKKIVTNYDSAFQKYLTRGKPGYVSKEKIKLQMAVDLINDAGGVVVLAHPLALNNDAMVEELLRTGMFEGIEAFYSNHKPNDTAHYIKLAEKYKLFVTGGSDSHGAAKSEIYIGIVKLKYDYIDGMKNYYSQKKKFKVAV
ncbi:MAG TPA: PHP domain-containing protein [bacterium]|mgnify:CR=1 FL=1|nr:PHP domain-containing protein [bacterium]HPP86800.1 PHP domain-containing protein [bacterium]